jgi:predicted glycosyltransferase involved in capsule biosynthesis
MDLNDLTLNIPIRYDTQDRTDNLNFIIDYFTNQSNVNIIVCEESKEKKYEYVADIKNIKYIHVYSESALFHRTKCLNICAKESKTKYIANYDCDVVFKQTQILQSINCLRSSVCDVIFPYSGVFYDVPRKYIDVLKQNNYNMDEILLKECEMVNINSFGGAIFWNKEKFMNIGMENENFISWGYEDNERVARLHKLNLRLMRTNGNLYHINHSRLLNSIPNNHTNLNQGEYNKILNMSEHDLRQYIKTWKLLT